MTTPTSAIREDDDAPAKEIEASVETKPASQESPHRWWIPIWVFFSHAVVGTVLFALIASPAILINVSIDYLAHKLSLGPVLIAAFLIVEYSILATDVILFLIFLIRSASRAVREL